jgi:hypothetical protein
MSALYASYWPYGLCMLCIWALKPFAYSAYGSWPFSMMHLVPVSTPHIGHTACVCSTYGSSQYRDSKVCPCELVFNALGER